MSEKTVVITEMDGKYLIQNNGIADFALIGILECILFDMKTASRKLEILAEQKDTVPESEEMIPDKSQAVDKSQTVTEPAKEQREAPQPAVNAARADAGIVSNAASALDLRTRINNAVKAIKGLGGEVKDIDRSTATDEELQTELEDLTNQYKRLKTSKGLAR
jgi:mannitol-specific phosphotransferase system IIBC component